MKNIYLLLAFLFIGNSLFAQTAEKLPVWKEGEMEIHHINTGKGESVFCIFPDGTTLLIDAGDISSLPPARVTPCLPNDSRSPGEWIARYISNRVPGIDKKGLDYFMLTHFHGDHMGIPTDQSPKTKKGGDYLLSGVSDVAEYVPFKKLIDRDWPSYDYPQPLKGKEVDNYRAFVMWNTQNTGMTAERFIPGANNQFVPINDPKKYASLFEVRNIVSNGEVWTGVGNQTRKHFPAGKGIDENRCSAGIRISYGKFDYFNGGDLSGRQSFNAEAWRNIEKPVGEVLGSVEVCEVNHHAYIDAMSDYFISCVQPQVFIMQVWDVLHLNLVTLGAMSSKGLYPGERDIFATNVHELARQYLGEANMSRVTGSDGHIVIKVEPEGHRYYVYVLNASDESYSVKSLHGPYECR